MTRTRLAGLLALFALAVPLHADFASIAAAIDAKQGVHRIWIPLLGLARTVVRVVEPKGVNDFQLATFSGANNLDSSELAALMETQAGPGFRPLVRAHSKRSDEWTFIYAKPIRDGKFVDLLILTHDDEDTVLVRVKLDGDVLAREMSKPENVRHYAR